MQLDYPHIQLFTQLFPFIDMGNWEYIVALKISVLKIFAGDTCLNSECLDL
jgi:hypothetical protein